MSWTLEPEWLSKALAGSDAEPLGSGELEVTLTKNGRDVLVRGRVQARVSMPDALTLEPVEIRVDSEVFLMLAPGASEPGHRRERGRADKPAAETARKPSKKGGWAGDPELGDDVAARDTYSGDQIVLDGFVREFLLLELPMVARKDLPSTPAPAIAPPSPEPSVEQPREVDPRLAPLAAIAERLREKKV